MALIMSMFIALIMTIVNIGFNDLFLKAWLTGWGMGFLVSLPLSVLLPPAIQHLMKKLGI
jgi:hypothetical protein